MGKKSFTKPQITAFSLSSESSLLTASQSSKASNTGDNLIPTRTSTNDYINVISGTDNKKPD